MGMYAIDIEANPSPLGGPRVPSDGTKRGGLFT